MLRHKDRAMSPEQQKECVKKFKDLNWRLSKKLAEKVRPYEREGSEFRYVDALIDGIRTERDAWVVSQFLDAPERQGVAHNLIMRLPGINEALDSCFTRILSNSAIFFGSLAAGCFKISQDSQIILNMVSIVSLWSLARALGTVSYLKALYRGAQAFIAYHLGLRVSEDSVKEFNNLVRSANDNTR